MNGAGRFHMLDEPLLQSTMPAGPMPLLRICAVASALAVLCVFVGGPTGPMAATLVETLSTVPSRVLVTGFKPFLNVTSNPAEEVALLLDGSCHKGVCIEGWALAVNESGVKAPAQSLLEDGMRWDAVIHLGFESVAKGLRIEPMAANVAASVSGSGAWSVDVPCNKSGSGWRAVDQDAPCLLATTAPLDALALPLLRSASGGEAAPAELWSRDAGTYYCNEVFFRSLRAVRSGLVAPRSCRPGLRLLPVIFIHLPPAPGKSTVQESATFVRAVAERMIARC